MRELRQVSDAQRRGIGIVVIDGGLDRDGQRLVGQRAPGLSIEVALRQGTRQLRILTPSTAVVAIDDCAISLSRVGPAGVIAE